MAITPTGSDSSDVLSFTSFSAAWSAAISTATPRAIAAAATAPDTSGDRLSLTGGTTSMIRGLLSVGNGTYSLAGGGAAGLASLFGNGFGADPEFYSKELLLLQLLFGGDSDKAKAILGTLRGLSGVSDPTLPSVETLASISVSFSFQASATSVTTEIPAAVAQTLDSFVLGIDVSVSVTTAAAQQGDPLVLDLNGDGIDLRSVDDGVDFDLAGTGKAARTAFVRGDDALLYLDADGNGVVDDGRELFGDQEGDANGFAELARHDENADGVIDAADSVVARLRLWRDTNGDGVNQASESLSLAEAGIASIALTCVEKNLADGLGNTLAQAGHFTRDDGSQGLAADMLLRYYS